MARRGGWRRRGRKPRFRYEDTRGRIIDDAAALERIAELAIPPAWRDVWISPNPGAKLQATGVDAAGRRQYLYHRAFRAAQERKKFERLVLFGERLPRLRRAVVADLELDPYEPSVRGDRVKFCFRGKHRVLVRTTIADAALADAIRALLDYPGGTRLFRYENGGSPALLTGPVLNDYVREHLGDGFTTKDFRTWEGTLAAALALAEHEPPESPGEERRILAAVMRRVGDELGNTAAVARSSYVSPAVIELWRQGRVTDASGPGPRAIDSRTRGLRPEEKALLSLLRSWRARKTRAA